VIFSLAVRLIGRLRHGLVFAGLAVLIALAVGLTGAAQSQNAGTASQPLSVPARSSLEVVRGLVERVTEKHPATAPPLSIAAVEPAAAPPPSIAAVERAAARPSADTAAQLRRVDASISRSGALARERITHATATPQLSPGDRVLATVSFYYCVDGAGPHPSGDGGNFCGAMRDGLIVYPGAAACDYVYLGQRFRIQGDPSQRVYECNDTGSAVHGLHRDIWFHTSDDGWRWQLAVGPRAVLEIVR
jgi:hypothetical protein